MRNIIASLIIIIILPFLTDISPAQTVSTILSQPCGDDFDLDSMGNIISTDYGGNKVRRITPSGNITILLEGYTNLGAVELGDSGTVIATNWNFGFAIKIWPGGQVDTLMRGLAGPSGIIRDGDGFYYINNNSVSGSINQIRKVKFYVSDTIIASGPPMQWGAGMAFDEDKNLYIANLFDGRIIKITPFGQVSTFATIPGGPSSTPVTGYMDHSNGNLYVCNLKDNKIYKISTDAGNSNFAFPIVIAGTGEPGYVDGPALTAKFYHPVAITASITGDTLYVGDGDGANMRLRMITGVSTAINQINWAVPQSFTLHQNYPNPFNPSTKIKFDIPESGKVSLKVYDILGREVAALVNEKLPAGSYEFDWNASGITSGIYFYTLTANNYRNAKKLIFSK